MKSCGAGSEALLYSYFLSGSFFHVPRKFGKYEKKMSLLLVRIGHAVPLRGVLAKTFVFPVCRHVGLKIANSDANLCEEKEIKGGSFAQSIDCDRKV